MKILVLLFVFISSLIFQNIYSQNYGKFTDSRDGEIYKTIKIGNQLWMAENMRYKTTNSWCYNNDDNNCQKYGRLYTFEEAKSAIPIGWRMPKYNDYEKLIIFLGGDKKVFEKIIEGGESGFNLLFGGFCFEFRSFEGLEKFAHIWCNHKDNNGAWTFSANKNDSIVELLGYSNLTNGYSLRCVYDE